MAKTLHLCLLVAVFIAVINSTQSESLVSEITSKDIDTKVGSGDWFVQFYSTKECPKCESVAKTWESLATKLKGKLNFGKVNCDVQTKLKNKFFLQRFPVLILFKGQTVRFYNSGSSEGEFSEEELLAFAETGYKDVKALPYVSQPTVIELTDDNFDTSISSGPWLVEFYAPWCGHCKQLAPIYEDVAQALEGISNVAKVDVTKNPALVERFAVKSMPKIFLILDEKITEFDGDRDVQTFVNFVTRHLNIPSPNSKPLPPSVDRQVVKAKAYLSVLMTMAKQYIHLVVPAVGFGGFIFGFLVGRFTAPKKEKQQ